MSIDDDFEGFRKRAHARLGTAEQAIAFAIEIDDHYDRKQFLEDWQSGMVASCDDWGDYWDWLSEKRNASRACAIAEGVTHGSSEGSIEAAPLSEGESN